MGECGYSSMRVAFKTKEKLETLKEHKRESFDDVLNRLMDFAPKVKDELVEDLIKDAEEYESKPAKRLKTISEFRRIIEGR